MLPTSVRFLSDGGDPTGFDPDIMHRHRERIARHIQRRGDLDVLTIRGGVMTIIETDEGDYLTASWYLDGDEDVVFAVAPGLVDEPPP